MWPRQPESGVRLRPIKPRLHRFFILLIGPLPERILRVAYVVPHVPQRCTTAMHHSDAVIARAYRTHAGESEFLSIVAAKNSS